MARARCWWLTPEILGTQEAEIRRIVFQGQPGQIVHKTLSRKTLHKNRAGRGAQGSSPSTIKKVMARTVTSGSTVVLWQ
jgi:hypothetical protein